MSLIQPKYADDDVYFEFFQKAVFERSGIHLTPAKKQLLETRLMKRVQELGLGSLEGYRAHLEALRQSDPEWQVLINRITTNKTDFFREPAHFKYLTEKFLPEWERRADGRKLSIWS